MRNRFATLAWMVRGFCMVRLSYTELDNLKVKMASSAFHKGALTWWNSEKNTRGREVTLALPWEGFKNLHVEQFCPRHELKKLEVEIRNLVQDSGKSAKYTTRFHELCILVPHLVTPLSCRIEKYIEGLPLVIRGTVMGTAVAWGAGQALTVEEVEVSPPQPSEIRIKVVSTSLCRSDVTAWLSQAQPPLFPRIFGHEASGIVESVGEEVSEFVESDHVLALFIGECMSCKQCVSSKKSNTCQQLGLERKGVMHSDQKTRFFIKGKPIYHYCAVSSFSEYTVVHSGCAVKITKDAPLQKVCLLSCGTAAGLGAAWNVANVSKGSTVAIFGLGTVGLSVAQGAKIRGASRIIGVDTNPEKKEKAKAFGVTDFINPNETEETVQQVLTFFLFIKLCMLMLVVMFQIIKRMTDGGVDYSFECIGDTEMVTTALQSSCDGWGVTVTLGVPKTKPDVTAHYGLFLTGRTLKGSLFGGWKPKSDVPSLIDMYLKGVAMLALACYLNEVRSRGI
ncbi:hypothetical protein E3N88_29414 [Mikania micrantha]|uniref:Enoyl reductase (ER) domain-containing protein n=1 Tax=Mikania micrantha TaxID=192012 RepID=A0A5N6MIQ5_9ASTR|nr:hypothetical protein E3N88_29414 [Mikania micrantha]